MIQGIGIDICEIQKVRDAIERTGQPFLHKFFTQTEIDLASSKPDIAVYFAQKFAAKEAILKAFKIGLSKYEGTDIEIVMGELGEPIVNLLGNLANYAATRGVKQVLVSTSSDGDYAIATSLLQD